MDAQTQNIRIFAEDRKKLIKDCKKEFLKHHPEMQGVKMTQPYILNKVIRYFLTDEV